MAPSRIPRVSITIPVFNGASTIERTIASVLAQTMVDFELLVIDDGSTDETGSLVRAITDRRLRYVRTPNRGRSAARNHGARLARAPALAFLDADDRYDPTFLERTYERLRDPKVDFVSTGIILPCRIDPFWYRALCNVVTGNKLFRREVVHALGGWSNHPFLRTTGEDILFSRVLITCFSRAHLDDPLFEYVHRPGNHLDRQLKTLRHPPTWGRAPFDEPAAKRAWKWSLSEEERFMRHLRELLLQESGKRKRNGERRRPRALARPRSKLPSRRQGPTVSIILPVLTPRDCIDAAVGSFLRQTTRNAELLLVGAVGDRHVERADSRVRSVPCDVGHPSAVRNLGLKKARGDVVAFWTPEASYEPSFVSSGMRALRDPRIDVVECGLLVETLEPGHYEFARILYLENKLIRKNVLEAMGGFARWESRDADAKAGFCLGLNALFHCRPIEPRLCRPVTGADDFGRLPEWTRFRSHDRVPAQRRPLLFELLKRAPPELTRFRELSRAALVANSKPSNLGRLWEDLQVGAVAPRPVRRKTRA